MPSLNVLCPPFMGYLAFQIHSIIKCSLVSWSVQLIWLHMRRCGRLEYQLQRGEELNILLKVRSKDHCGRLRTKEPGKLEEQH